MEWINFSRDQLQFMFIYLLLFIIVPMISQFPAVISIYTNAAPRNLCLYKKREVYLLLYINYTID